MNDYRCQKKICKKHRDTFKEEIRQKNLIIAAMKERITELERKIDRPHERLETQLRANDQLLKELAKVKDYNTELDMILNLYQRRLIY